MKFIFLFLVFTFSQLFSKDLPFDLNEVIVDQKNTYTTWLNENKTQITDIERKKIEKWFIKTGGLPSSSQNIFGRGKKGDYSYDSFEVVDLEKNGSKYLFFTLRSSPITSDISIWRFEKKSKKFKRMFHSIGDIVKVNETNSKINFRNRVAIDCLISDYSFDKKKRKFSANYRIYLPICLYGTIPKKIETPLKKFITTRRSYIDNIGEFRKDETIHALSVSKNSKGYIIDSSKDFYLALFLKSSKYKVKQIVGLDFHERPKSYFKNPYVLGWIKKKNVKLL